MEQENKKLKFEEKLTILRVVVITTLINLIVSSLSWISINYWGWTLVWFLIGFITLIILTIERLISITRIIRYFIVDDFDDEDVTYGNKLLKKIWLANISYWAFTLILWIYLVLSNIRNF